MSEATPAEIQPSSSAEPVAEERHGWSHFGIAAIVVAFSSGALLMLSFTLAVVWHLGKDVHTAEPTKVHSGIVGLAVIAAFGGFLVGTGLGIAGLFESKRRRGPAIIGLTLNGVGLLALALLLIVGVLLRR